MNREQIGENLALGMIRDKQVDDVIERLGEIIAQSFSALCNLCPETSLSVLEQLNDQKAGIEELAESHVKHYEKLAKKIATGFHYTEEE